MGEGRYAAVECLICGRYLALDVSVGYRKCPYCGYVNMGRFEGCKDVYERKLLTC